MNDRFFQVYFRYIFPVFFVAVLVFGVWMSFFAPCSALGWVPVQSLPSRCLTITKP